jgi:hypothetical protein
MKHWEFLLQKEGDRSWLSLDAPSVEILEGRYRLVVRCDRSDSAISLRICHTTTEQTPPIRRIQRRLSRTNANGLMVMMPFTRLEPGLWEFQCTSGDPMADLVGDAWRYAIQLHVLHLSTADEWEPDWGEPEVEASELAEVPIAAQVRQSEVPQNESAQSELVQHELPQKELVQTELTATEFTVTQLPEVAPAVAQPPLAASVTSAIPLPPAVAQILGASMTQFSQLTEQMSEQLIDQVMQEFEQSEMIPSSTKALDTSIAFQNLASPRQLPNSEAFAISLTQEAFVASQGETLVVTGQVRINPEQSIAPQRITPAAIAPAAIVDPWAATESSVVVQELQLYLRDPQSLQVLCHDRLPMQTHLQSFSFSPTLPDFLSTRLILGEVLLCGALADESVTLATQTFTITVNPAELVQELANLHRAIAAESTDPKADTAAASGKLAEASILNLSFLNLGSPEPIPEPTPAKPTQSLGGQPLPPQLYPPNPNQRSGKLLDLPSFQEASTSAVEPMAEQPSEVVEAESAPIALESSPSEALPALEMPIISTSPMVDDQLPPDTPEPPASNLPAYPEFQALNLQERFLTRLSAIAGDTQLSASMPLERTGAIVPMPALSEEMEHLAYEVVVSDDPVEATQPTGSDAVVLPVDDPIPVPELYLTTGELIAGESVTIRVKLPQSASQICVKLWMNDLQTRTLLDRPCWLLDWLPDGHGAIEATTQLAVPFGSVEIRFAAIAVEMATQRESHKAEIDRVVVPPNLPGVSLDLFDA